MTSSKILDIEPAELNDDWAAVMLPYNNGMTGFLVPHANLTGGGVNGHNYAPHTR